MDARAICVREGVAPPAGAWIETKNQPLLMYKPIVAPPAGAWIETYIATKVLTVDDGRAPRGRVD